MQFSSNTINPITITQDMRDGVRAKSKGLRQLAKSLNCKADVMVDYMSDELVETRYLGLPKPSLFTTVINSKVLTAKDLKSLAVDCRRQRRDLLLKYREIRAYLNKAKRLLAHPDLPKKSPSLPKRILKASAEAVSELILYVYA